ncbi:MAG: methionine ABC transporter ATP-binding protein, partial [Clostridia bacterium]|nr:methionine ABC transporter ATP-binding protein [Clostridia bacterium]
GVVAEFAQRILVMYAGQPIEEAETVELFGRPLHPYTKGLLASLPKMNEQTDRLHTIAGNVPSPNAMPQGCRFRDRCPHAQALCAEQEPAMRELGPGHTCKCHFAEHLTEEKG